MAAKVYCSDCQRLVRSDLLAHARVPRCPRCVARQIMGVERYRVLSRAGLLAATANGRGQLGG